MRRPLQLVRAMSAVGAVGSLAALYLSGQPWFVVGMAVTGIVAGGVYGAASLALRGELDD